MKIIATVSMLFTLISCQLMAQEVEREFENDTIHYTRSMFPANYQIDFRIDNMGYWRRLAQAGFVPVAPDAPVPAAIQRSSQITARGKQASNSPDVLVTTSPSTQSENSIFIEKENDTWLLNSNNSTPNPSSGTVYGANSLYSYDGGGTWNGSVQGAGGSNSGDPAAVIGPTGRWYIGFINNASGQSIAYSDNHGTSWTTKVVANAPAGFLNMLDKNHLWVDNGPSSPYLGVLYDAWMPSGGTNNGQIEISRSTNNGTSWSTPKSISNAINAGSHNQGVNIKTGPNGEVYTAWAVYDAFPADEKAIGFSKSLDGGQNWTTAVRVINNIKGIRNHGVTETMRVNSFPSMAVDLSNGPNSGAIYIVWTNVNTPGVNSGSGVEVYMIKSTDKGDTWSTPVKVNTDPLGTNKQHYLPWITCDASNGNLSVVFYDNRNVLATQAEAWVACSTDGGASWTDFRVSDVSFTPQPIAGLADNYFGDYLAIDARDGMVYPCWTDNRSGHALTYVSPFQLTQAMNQAFIAYNSHTLNDATTGNNNGELDAGEDILLGLNLENVGDMADTAVIAGLSSSSPFVSFMDPSEDYGDFLVGEQKFIANGYRFHVSDSIADGEEVVFEVSAVDIHDSVMKSSFSIEAHAPNIAIGALSINDAAGNNNQVLEPGETAEITIQYTNTGDLTATGAVSYLNIEQSYVSVLSQPVSLGSVFPGQVVTATFTVKAANVVLGSPVVLDNLVKYTSHTAQKQFVESLGLIVEDWETGTFTKFPWQLGGNANWGLDGTTVYEKVYSARSGAVSHGQVTSLEVPYAVLYDDSLSFFRKISSEMFHDNLSFSIDGAKVGQWSGNDDWKRFSFAVKAGAHTFKWEYAKDAAGTADQDGGWIDFILFPPGQKTQAWAGDDLNICSGEPVQLNGAATYCTSPLWTTTGSGVFNNAGILNPVYSPSQADIDAGTVSLVLWANNPGGTSVQDTLVITIFQKPVYSISSNSSLCQGDSVLVSYHFLQGLAPYSVTFAGGISKQVDAAQLEEWLKPLHDTTLQILSVTDAHGCTSTTHVSQGVIVYSLPLLQLGADTAACGNRQVVLVPTSPQAIDYLWMPGGKTSSTLTVDTVGLGLGTCTYALTIADAHGCKAMDSIKVTFQNCSGVDEMVGQVRFRLYPNPNQGDFAIELFSATAQTIDLKLVSPTGDVLYERKGLAVVKHSTEKVKLPRSVPGVYLLMLNNAGVSVSKEVVISR